MLLIEDLKVNLGDKEILRHIDLEIRKGETHILFGPNGSGKTSLLMTIMGYPQYKVVSGKISFKGEDITHMRINERAELGIGMSYQRPPSIQGLKPRALIDICSNTGGDTAALAEQILRAAEDDKLLQRAKDEGPRIVAQRGLWSAQIEILDSCYQNTLQM